MKLGKAFGLILIFLGLITLYAFRDASSFLRLALASVGMVWIIKCAALIWQISDGTKPRSAVGTLLYLFA